MMASSDAVIITRTDITCNGCNGSQMEEIPNPNRIWVLLNKYSTEPKIILSGTLEAFWAYPHWTGGRGRVLYANTDVLELYHIRSMHRDRTSERGGPSNKTVGFEFAGHCALPFQDPDEEWGKRSPFLRLDFRTAAAILGAKLTNLVSADVPDNSADYADQDIGVSFSANVTGLDHVLWPVAKAALQSNGTWARRSAPPLLMKVHGLPCARGTSRNFCGAARAWVRPNTTDVEGMQQVFDQGEFSFLYKLPPPSTVLDAGGELMPHALARSSLAYT